MVEKNRTNKIQELGLEDEPVLANNDEEKITEEFRRLATPITIRWEETELARETQMK